MVDPVSLSRLVLECERSKFRKHSEYVEVEEVVKGRRVSLYVPVCSRNNFLCEYAGQQVLRFGTVICDGRLKYDGRSVDVSLD